VSAGYFRVLGVQPAVGRDFLDSDDQVNGPAVVVLSDGLWRRRFGAAGGIVGSQITLNGTPYTVIGVMPAGFENVLASSAEVWAPLQYDQSLPPEGREWGHHLRMVGRLHSGIDVDDVGRDLDMIARTPVSDFTRKPWASLSTGVVVNPLHDDVIRAVKPALLAILGAVVLLLAIAGVNVTNMLLARGVQRRGEFAMRAALGAERVRLLRQLLTESLLLSLLGGAIGMLVAQAGLRAFVALSPAELPRAAAIQVDGAVFLFALGTVTLIGLLVGLIPAVQAGRSDPHLTLRESARSSVGSHQLTRRALVVSEIALAVVLLLGAGLLFRSLGRLFAITPGFDPSRLLTMQVQTSGGQFEDDISTHRFFDQALDAVRQVPGVEAAAFTSQLPLSGDFEKYGVQFESSPDISVNDDQSAFRYAVSPGYFETMGIPLRQGRLLEAPDQQEGPIAVLLNESLARRRFPGQDPIGQRLHLGSTDQPWYTVVGVVGDVKQASLEVTQGDAVYIPASRWYSSDRVRSLVVRVRDDAEALVPSLKNAIWSVDKDQPIVRIATMDHLLAQSAAERRFAFLLFQAFAVAALILAAIGIYGVLSGSVTERIREIGVRSALGATRQNILGLVIRQGMSLTGLGVGIGLAGAVAASRAIVSLLFGVSRLDPITHLGVIALLAGVSLIACWIPAWRAARVDPSITLRTE
jgi:putative ABC transport system permease protein